MEENVAEKLELKKSNIKNNKKKKTHQNETGEKHKKKFSSGISEI